MTLLSWLTECSPFVKLSILPCVVYMVTYWVLSGFFCLVDYILEQYGDIKKHKLQPNAILKDDKIDWDKYYKTAKYVLRNQVFVTLPMALIAYPFWDLSVISPVLPSIWNILKTGIISIIIQDVMFFSIHYLFHKPYLYGKIHKIHHEWVAPIACSGNYNHPLEHALINMLPAVIGPMLTKMHITTFLLWIFLEALVVTVTHSGYNWWFLFAEKHDNHHRYFNYNYGVMHISDRLFGTIYRKKATPESKIT